MDAYNVAFRVPHLLRDLFAEGAMSAAFVPTFTTHLARYGKAAAWRLGNDVLNALALITGVFVVLGVLFAGPLVTAFAGEFAAVPGKLELTVLLARIMLPLLTLVAIAAAVMGMLNALHHYFLPALSPAMFNVASIVSVVTLAPVLHAVGLPPVLSVAIGAVLGGVGQIALQWPALAVEGFRYRPVLDLYDPGLRRMLILMGPGTLGLAATQVNLFVNTHLAANEGTGAVSWLSFAFRVMYLPIGLFGVSIATAVLPAAARHAERNDAAAIRTTFARGLSLMLALNIPAAAGLVLLSVPIVKLLFERGQFLPADTQATAAALQLYAIGLLGYSTARIATPVFYALGQSRVPVLISTASVVLNAVFSLALVPSMSYRGLALGTSLAAVVHGALSLWLLRRRLGGLHGRMLAISVAKVSAATVVMCVVVVLVSAWTQTAIGGDATVAQGLRLSITIAVAMAALAVAGRVLRIDELERAVASFRARVRLLLGSRSK